jgi:ectoine hydroxylase-related dioxygenase (phytanoyl-CoA dioxygenase family)
MEKSYGINRQSGNPTDEIENALEDLVIKGYTVLEGVLNEKELQEARKRLDSINDAQTKKLSVDYLEKINELDIVRCPFIEDPFFLDIATNATVAKIAERLLGDYYILHLQNGIINKPSKEHHQSSWHRDLPYQNFEISSPLAISALFCIDEFSAQTGGTNVLPFSHRLKTIPSDTYIKNNALQVSAPAGAVVIFDSMLLHKAGYNSSNIIRRGINNVYVKPILKQQINIPKALGGKYSDNAWLRKFLGYDSQMPDSIEEFRESRMKKKSQH